ncbi:GIY-YIG nuclease family protein [uncultured Draconibacterium sp.]|uniref:GIY-YIG nuclease family protein n=1 Tax=uncultured Draconibacterium sp. TaxID=1573823 RepID=UPI0029C8E649|nr:GIY-YIG nuclease family protein [uncultured Draconibacterium sp.]
MDKHDILNEIFSDDPLGLLKIKPKSSSQSNGDEQLISKFKEINAFVESNGNKEPEANPGNVFEFQLYSRLKSLRNDDEKIEILKPHDTYNLLPEYTIVYDELAEPKETYKTQKKPKQINSIDDILGGDSLDILGGDSEGLFEFKHTPKEYERANADFVARRKPCKDFKTYKPLLEAVQADLASGKRKLIDFNMGNLRVGSYYVHNGVLFLLEEINITHKEHYKPDGTRVREDGRTRCIFENGTQSNMLKRSVEKILYANGKVVTENIDKVNEGFLEKFGTITKEDEEAGYIYVLKSKSSDSRITAIKDLYKIGYSKTDVTERIKNAEKEPTYLMAPVEYIAGWKCFNMNTQKFEQLIHNFFGNSCLEVDVFDDNGKRYTPREWFIAPLETIEQAIALIINGDIIKYRYDADNGVIELK